MYLLNSASQLLELHHHPLLLLNSVKLQENEVLESLAVLRKEEDAMLLSALLLI